MPAAPRFERVCIAGLGLLGGSLGMALRERRLAGRVVGVARREATVDAAMSLGAVDEATRDLRAGAAGADLLVVAVPVLATVDLIAEAAGVLAPGAIVTDVGSTKGHLERAVPPLLPPGVVFVGGHPMAGSERTGIEVARADLFEGATYVITRPPETPPEAAARVAALARDVGAVPLEMEADRHDEAVARISHLPHVAAAALATAAARGDRKFLARLAAGGFRDTTRIAASSPEMWRDICLTNRDPLLAALADLETDLAAFRRAVEEGDPAALEALFAAGRRARLRVMESAPAEDE